jgi:hypothetical protein
MTGNNHIIGEPKGLCVWCLEEARINPAEFYSPIENEDTGKPYHICFRCWAIEKILILEDHVKGLQKIVYGEEDEQARQLHQ